MSARRYRAPLKDGEILLDPMFDEVGSLLAENRAILDHAAVRIDGEPLSAFRRQAVVEILAASRDYHAERGEPIPPFENSSLLLTGHQPEWVHPGVWIKNFALNRLAHRHQLVPLSLVVDTDTVKSTSLRLPVLPLESAHLESVPFDQYLGETVYEDRRVLDAALLQSFAERTATTVKTWEYPALIAEVWRDEVIPRLSPSETVSTKQRPLLLGEITVEVRRAWERRWGCHNLEIPISRLCGTVVFRRFVHHILNDLPRFHAVYNRCVQEYRKTNGIRSLNHPVPDLAREGDRFEVPFWIVRPGDDRRGRLFAVPGETLPADAAIRTRALTTTMFARVCLGVAFIHGIGGGIYDEVTDAILEAWLGLRAPRIIVMSGTLRLPLPRYPYRSREASLRMLREMQWNPQRHLSLEATTNSEVQRLIRLKQDLIDGEPVGKADRRRWFGELSEVTGQLRGWLGDATARVELTVAQHERQRQVNELLLRRDFAWPLFPESILRRWLTCFGEG